MAELNLDYYTAKDHYSDGDIEETLLKMAQEGKSFEDLPEEEVSFPMVYHFSGLRENILSWYPLKKADSVLEIGAGCGAITGMLCRKAGHVTSVELSKRRADINYARNRDKENLTIMVGNLNDMTFPEKFDYVVVNGVLEYAMSFTEGKTPYETFLQRMGAYLKPEGRLLIATLPEHRRITQIFIFSGSMDIREISLCEPFPRMNWESCWKTAAFLFCAFTTRIRIINFRQRFLQMRAFIPIPTEEAILYTQIRQQIFLQKVKA